jgi:hypothetical protein
LAIHGAVSALRVRDAPHVMCLGECAGALCRTHDAFSLCTDRYERRCCCRCTGPVGAMGISRKTQRFTQRRCRLASSRSVATNDASRGIGRRALSTEARKGEAQHRRSVRLLRQTRVLDRFRGAPALGRGSPWRNKRNLWHRPWRFFTQRQRQSVRPE